MDAVPGDSVASRGRTPPERPLADAWDAAWADISRSALSLQVCQEGPAVKRGTTEATGRFSTAKYVAFRSFKYERLGGRILHVVPLVEVGYFMAELSSRSSNNIKSIRYNMAFSMYIRIYSIYWCCTCSYWMNTSTEVKLLSMKNISKL